MAKRSAVKIRRKLECALDSYRFCSMVSDNQYQAGMMFRWSYLWAVRDLEVTDNGRLKLIEIDSAVDGGQHIAEAEQNLSLIEFAVVSDVCGWDKSVGAHRLKTLRTSLDKLFCLWFGGEIVTFTLPLQPTFGS